MQIHEVIRLTGLTKKAIEYYIGQGLLSPAILENNYRNFDDSDVNRLKQIAVLRRLGLSIPEISDALSDGTRAVLSHICTEKELLLQKEQKKRTLLGQLCRDGDYDTAAAALAALEQNSSISERLLHAFPGYLGRYLCLHFSAYLQDPAATAEQEAAYRDIIRFLDEMPTPQFSPAVCALLDEMNAQCTDAQMSGICDITDTLRQCAADPTEFLTSHQNAIDTWLAFRQTKEYQNSPLSEFQSVMQDFCQTSGYYDIFLPAMERLSPSYAAYRRLLAAADDALLRNHPALAGKAAASTAAAFAQSGASLMPAPAQTASSPASGGSAPAPDCAGKEAP